MLERAKGRGPVIVVGGPKKFTRLQSYCDDNIATIDVLTTLLYTSIEAAELALAVSLHHNAFKSQDNESRLFGANINGIELPLS